MEIQTPENEENIYTRAREKLKDQDFGPIDKYMNELQLKAFETLDLRSGDIVCLQPQPGVTQDRLAKIADVARTTKQAMGIDINFLVIPHDFELRILRPESNQCLQCDREAVGTTFCSDQCQATYVAQGGAEV